MEHIPEPSARPPKTRAERSGGLPNRETALLELNENAGDLELVGRVFRGLHTIKGSGAMFGFEELAAFTHNLETAFDEVRNGRLEVNPELIDLTLTALDQIRAMLEEGGEGAAADEALHADSDPGAPDDGSRWRSSPSPGWERSSSWKTRALLFVRPLRPPPQRSSAF
ncbi:MAG: Hpt domain-containing protein [Terracidiphilus sp.]